jgi:hypothetical protein
MRPGARVWAFAAAALLLVGAAAIAIAHRDRGPDISPRAEAKRPPLLLVTSLPLLFPEEFTLEAGGSPALSALESRYRVLPIGTTDPRSLSQSSLLLMAHPLAQPAEDLVALDEWVRSGGRVLLLADPRLDWPSERPLGDKLRPPPSFADTGLLAHWGLTLEGPRISGPASYEAGPFFLVASSPGTLKSNGECRVSTARLVAECKVGKGSVTVVADADFLNVGGDSEADEGNLGFLLDALARLER